MAKVALIFKSCLIFDTISIIFSQKCKKVISYLAQTLVIKIITC